jgi:hypothetical protein
MEASPVSIKRRAIRPDFNATGKLENAAKILTSNPEIVD